MSYLRQLILRLSTSVSMQQALLLRLRRLHPLIGIQPLLLGRIITLVACITNHVHLLLLLWLALWSSFESALGAVWHNTNHIFQLVKGRQRQLKLSIVS